MIHQRRSRGKRRRGGMMRNDVAERSSARETETERQHAERQKRLRLDDSKIVLGMMVTEDSTAIAV
jgi:hypothetical protein